MTKRYYEKGRLKYFSRNQLIDFDPPTISAIAIAISIFIFGLVVFVSFNTWSKLINSKSEILESKIKKEGDLYALNFIEPPHDSPEEIKQQVKAQEITPPSEINKELTKEVTPEKKLHTLAKPEVKPTPKPMLAEAQKNNEPKPTVENKPTPSKDSGSTSTTPDAQSPLSVNSTSEQAESEEHIFYRKLLESFILEKLTLYKSSFPDKWKRIGGSFIVDVDIVDGEKPTFTIITNSPNFYFNQVSDLILKTIKYPALKNYNLKKYHQTFILTYRPYGDD